MWRTVPGFEALTRQLEPFFVEQPAFLCQRLPILRHRLSLVELEVHDDDVKTRYICCGLWLNFCSCTKIYLCREAGSFTKAASATYDKKGLVKCDQERIVKTYKSVYVRRYGSEECVEQFNLTFLTKPPMSVEIINISRADEHHHFNDLQPDVVNNFFTASITDTITWFLMMFKKQFPTSEMVFFFTATL